MDDEINVKWLGRRRDIFEITWIKVVQHLICKAYINSSQNTWMKNEDASSQLLIIMKDKSLSSSKSKVKKMITKALNFELSIFFSSSLLPSSSSLLSTSPSLA